MANKPPFQSHDPFVEREAQKYETPVPSREYILAVLTELGGAVKRRALIKHFSLDDEDRIEGLRRRLKAMVRDGQLFKTPQGYIPIVGSETCQGTLVMEREWEGYVDSESGQTVLLNGSTLRGYYDGDEIEVQIIQVDKQGNARGRIVQLLKGTTPLVIGRLVKDHHLFSILPFDRKFSQNITIPKGKKGQAKDGDIVQVKILREEKYQTHSEPVGEVIDVLGDFSTPGIEVNMAVRKFSIPHEWPKAVLKECSKLNKEVTHTDEREDLIDLPLVTIDGEDAKDFDDAVYCEKREQGGFRLWVAIADVSYYVKPGSALDKEAQMRGNSTYFPGSVIPMLPEVLSNELCSLKPKVRRLCVVCQMSISADGDITRSTFFRAVMRSQVRFTYTEVAEIVRGNKALQEQYAPQVQMIQDLHELYQTLHRQRKQRGAIDFDTIETRILFDLNGKIKSIVPTVRNVAHKMIEESMLAANVCAAKFIDRNKRGSLFRIHDRPPTDKLTALRQFLSELGLDLPGRTKPTPKDFSTLIERIQHREDRHMIETVMLRSLSQAQYSPNNIGHFGLAYPHYVHFTSPIRRYPDLIVHRVIIDILAANKSKKHKITVIDLEKIALHCSETERRSDDATRDAQLALKCHYMQDKVGQHFRGVVSGVANFGVFVELKDVYVEGMIHVTALGDEYYQYDPNNHRLVGDRTRKTYRLGDALDVQVVRVDIEAKRIDLELSESAQKHPTRKTHLNKKKFKHSRKLQRRSKRH